MDHPQPFSLAYKNSQIGADHKDNRFAIIIDEAHSGQSGRNSAQMNLALSGLASDDEMDNEDKINAMMEGRKLLLFKPNQLMGQPCDRIGFSAACAVLDQIFMSDTLFPHITKKLCDNIQLMIARENLLFLFLFGILRGYNDGAGNPPNPNGLMTDYLWKDILTKEKLTLIIENYAQVVVEVDEDTKKKKEKQIFPRYGQ